MSKMKIILSTLAVGFILVACGGETCEYRWIQGHYSCVYSHSTGFW